MVPEDARRDRTQLGRPVRRLQDMRARLVVLGTAAAILAVASIDAVPAARPTAQATSIFTFKTDGFWLNLHTFLYVLGRDRFGAADRTREAVAGAPRDQAAGLEKVSASDRRAWEEAVAVYAAGLSKLDAVFDAEMVNVTGALSRSGGSDAPLPPLPAAVRAALERAAPVYLRVWWPAHNRANERWVEDMRPLVDRHGPSILAFITRAYAARWPAGGYPVNVAAYSNWAGAYSTSGNLLVVSSLNAGNRGTQGLEIAFHEAMHQWDDQVQGDLAAAARTHGKPAPPDLSHAMIFFTAGEAARRAIPGHVPYADANGIWSRRLGVFKSALDQAWLPWLAGSTTREAALLELARLASGG